MVCPDASILLYCIMPRSYIEGCRKYQEHSRQISHINQKKRQNKIDVIGGWIIAMIESQKKMSGAPSYCEK